MFSSITFGYFLQLDLTYLGPLIIVHIVSLGDAHVPPSSTTILDGCRHGSEADGWERKAFYNSKNQGQKSHNADALYILFMVMWTFGITCFINSTVAQTTLQLWSCAILLSFGRVQQVQKEKYSIFSEPYFAKILPGFSVLPLQTKSHCANGPGWPLWGDDIYINRIAQFWKSECCCPASL